MTKAFRVQNTNKILGRIQINGIKTGMTRAAGQCLSTSSELRPIVEKLPDEQLDSPPSCLYCSVAQIGLVKQRPRRAGMESYNQWVQSGAVVNSVREACGARSEKAGVILTHLWGQRFGIWLSGIPSAVPSSPPEWAGLLPAGLFVAP